MLKLGRIVGQGYRNIIGTAQCADGTTSLGVEAKTQGFTGGLTIIDVITYAIDDIAPSCL